MLYYIFWYTIDAWFGIGFDDQLQVDGIVTVTSWIQ
jgi:hypothetical protein